MRGGHGGGGCVEKDSLAAGGDSAVENGLRQGSTDCEAARDGAHPKALELPGIRSDCCRERTPGDESGGLLPHMGDEATAALLVVGERKPGGFFLKRSETEAGRARLGDDKAAVFEKQAASLSECAVRGRCRDFLQIE